jgi:hypothetical protein
MNLMLVGPVKLHNMIAVRSQDLRLFRSDPAEKSRPIHVFHSVAFFFLLKIPACFNTLPVKPVQPLNRGVQAPHPVYFMIICAAPSDLMIRVWVPQQYAGQLYTRPRVNGSCLQRRNPRNAFPGGSFFPEAGEREPGRMDHPCVTISPPGRI